MEKNSFPFHKLPVDVFEDILKKLKAPRDHVALLHVSDTRRAYAQLIRSHKRPSGRRKPIFAKRFIKAITRPCCCQCGRTKNTNGKRLVSRHTLKFCDSCLDSVYSQLVFASHVQSEFRITKPVIYAATDMFVCRVRCINGTATMYYRPQLRLLEKQWTRIKSAVKTRKNALLHLVDEHMCRERATNLRMLMYRRPPSHYEWVIK